MTTKLFDVPGDVVMQAVACTWCGADLGEGCSDYKWREFQPAAHPHAQRWYDYWNATHEKADHIEVRRAPLPSP